MGVCSRETGDVAKARHAEHVYNGVEPRSSPEAPIDRSNRENRRMVCGLVMAMAVVVMVEVVNFG